MESTATSCMQGEASDWLAWWNMNVVRRGDGSHVL